MPGEVYDVAYHPTRHVLYFTHENGKIMKINNNFLSTENAASELLELTGAYGIALDSCHGCGTLYINSTDNTPTLFFRVLVHNVEYGTSASTRFFAYLSVLLLD